MAGNAPFTSPVLVNHSAEQVEADAKHSIEVVNLLLDILERTSHLNPAPVNQQKAPADATAAAAAGAAKAEADAAASSGRATRRTTRASRQAAAAAEAEQPSTSAGAAAAGDGATEEEYAQAMQSLQVSPRDVVVFWECWVVWVVARKVMCVCAAREKMLVCCWLVWPSLVSPLAALFQIRRDDIEKKVLRQWRLPGKPPWLGV
jgi:hypothetical protein